MTEWLDIVDELDRVVGKDTRARVHAGGLIHRSSHVLLTNSHGQVFVQLRSMSKDTNPGLWDTSAAGHVDSGETYLQCAVRELHEELGIVAQAQDFKQIGKLEPTHDNGHEFTHIYAVCADGPVVLEADEIDDGRWLLPSELDGWLLQDGEHFTDVFKIIWNRYTLTNS